LTLSVPKVIVARVRTAELDFRLPERLIATVPVVRPGARRDHARLMVLERGTGAIEHSRFGRLEERLRAGDLLVVNDSCVVQDVLVGRSAGGPMKLILCGHHVDGWHVLVRPAKLARRGAVVEIGGGALRAVLVSPSIDDLWLARFDHDGDFLPLLETFGRRFITRGPMKRHAERYRSIFAARPGSLEIPSAGLHFTPALVERLRAKGVEIAAITLHIGLTELSQFRHIDAERLEDHEVAAEWYEVTPTAARAIEGARRRGGRVVAVGTTVVRTLETVAARRRGGVGVRAGEGWTDLYVRPGHEFRLVDAIVTNLHQPRSSHLALVAAFAGKELTLEALPAARPPPLPLRPLRRQHADCLREGLGLPGRARTCDPQLRRLLLYPPELRGGTGAAIRD
jgi:S-adenosylmethionine:tRNA ribosyltransferase-isomerase